MIYIIFESSHWADVKPYLTHNAATYCFWDFCFLKAHNFGFWGLFAVFGVLKARLITGATNVVNTSHRYCVNFIGCRSDDELHSRLPAWYTKCCQAKYLSIWLTIFISPQKVLLAPSSPLRGESALSLWCVVVTDVLLQLDDVSRSTYLPVCEARNSLHRIQKTTENIHVSDRLRHIETFLSIAHYKYSYLLTYLPPQRGLRPVWDIYTQACKVSWQYVALPPRYLSRDTIKTENKLNILQYAILAYGL